MRLEVEICDNWNGLDKVCDSERCSAQLEQCNYECYHKPYKINGERKTVVEAMLAFLKKYKAG